MKLSISNIAWSVEYDDEIYKYLSAVGVTGMEIAPTRVFIDKPYDRLNEAKAFSDNLKSQYNLTISSMQSIWFGKTERVFGTDEERQILINYTKKAIDFANITGCGNLVFGCPKNRIIDNDGQYEMAIEFFQELGQYAFDQRTVLSIEPNPQIYGTNFINHTEQAFELVRDIGNKGVMVNIDLGTTIYNHEDLKLIPENLTLVNHIHISEPYLAVIKKRDLHNELAKVLRKNSYDKFVSIEMKNVNNIGIVKDTIKYMKEVFE